MLLQLDLSYQTVGYVTVRLRISLNAFKTIVIQCYKQQITL